MKKKIKFILLASLCIIFGFVQTCMAKIQIPNPKSEKYINDYTGSVSQSTIDYVVEQGRTLEDRTGAQFVVVIMPDIEGWDVERFALELGREWGIGQAEKNNGLLLVFAMKEHKVRLEVGRGLEGAIPDSKTVLIDQNVIPHMKNDDLDSAIIAGYNVYEKEIYNEYNIDTSNDEFMQVPEVDGSQDGKGFLDRLVDVLNIIVIVLAIVSFLIPLFTNRRRRRGRGSDDDDDWGGFGGGGFFGGDDSGGFGGGDSGGGFGGGDFGGGGGTSSW